VLYKRCKIGEVKNMKTKDRLARMAQAITDCGVLLCRGMGRGAYESMKGYGIMPILTDTVTITEAVKNYIEGGIADHIDRLH
jgi:predicted Fe-Mo cluster-binding NifX family protein